MYWAAAQLQPLRTNLALHCLAVAGFTTYLPRILERRTVRGRRVDSQLPLFPGYCFVWIRLQWRAAHYAPGVIRLITNGDGPTPVPDHIIDAIRSRERNGVVVLPSQFKRGDQVRVLRGPFRQQLALYDGQAPHERVAVLLSLFSGQRRVTLPRDDVEPTATN